MEGMDPSKLMEMMQGGSGEEKLKEMAAKMMEKENLVVDEEKTNDLPFHQILGFLKTEGVQEFRKLKTPEERIQFIYRQEAYWPLLQSIRKSDSSGHSSSRKGEKDGLLSRQMRDAGNTAFQQSDDDLALKCYNEALLIAPADPWDGQGEDMSLAFANRSALFNRQAKTSECLRDTGLALSAGYPQHLSYKLLQRQAKCHLQLNNTTQAKKDFKEALSALQRSKLSKEQRRTVQADIETALEEILAQESTEKENEEPKPAPEPKPEEEAEDDNMSAPFPDFVRHPRFPSLSRSLAIKYDSRRGRHCVALEDISCGNYIAFENSLLSFLWAENLLSHCSTCFTPVAHPVPCYTCSLVVFCTSECRTKAWSSFHQYECKAMEALTSAFQNVFPAYRAIAQKPLRYFIENKSKFTGYDPHRAAGCYQYQYENDSESGETEPDSEEEDYQLNFAYRCKDYENFFHLKKHTNKQSEADVLAFSTSACLLLYYLKISNYFGGSASRECDRELNDTELLVATLIYHFLEVLQSNTDVVSQATDWSPEKGITVEELGCCVSPTFALLNHSCNPNTVRANIGTASLLLTTANIRKGQEVTVCYSNMHYQDKLISTRQKILQERYNFNCGCKSCVKKWPQYEFMNKSTAIKGCTTKDLNYIKKMFTTISKLTMADLKVGHYDRILAMWSTYFNQLELTLEQPNKGFLRLQNRLKDVIWLRWGNRGPKCMAPKPVDHKVTIRKSNSNVNIPTELNSQEEEKEEESKS